MAVVTSDTEKMSKLFNENSRRGSLVLDSKDIENIEKANEEEN